jgi:hypothetical protein
MIRLIAFAPRDGWALVREGEQWWHLQPPYRRADRRLLDTHVAERALMEQGFTPRDEPFADWGTLTRALVQERVRALDSGERKATLGAWRAVLRRTTAERAREHLKTMAAWIEEGDGVAAGRALVQLLAAPAVKESPELVSEVSDLIGRVLDQRERRSQSGAERTEWPVDDPREIVVAQESYQRVAFRESA